MSGFHRNFFNDSATPGGAADDVEREANDVIDDVRGTDWARRPRPRAKRR